MPKPEIDIVVTNIMGREFKLKCPKDKTAELEKAASYLNKKMQEIQHGDKSITIDRVAIAAALNIAHELILAKQAATSHIGDLNSSNQHFSDLVRKIDQALAKEES